MVLRRKLIHPKGEKRIVRKISCADQEEAKLTHLDLGIQRHLRNAGQFLFEVTIL